MNIKELKTMFNKLTEDINLRSVLSKMLPLNELFVSDSNKEIKEKDDDDLG